VNLEINAGNVTAKHPESIHHRILVGVARAVMQICLRHGGGAAVQLIKPGQERRYPDAPGYPDLVGLAVASVEVKTAVGAFNLHCLTHADFLAEIAGIVTKGFDSNGVRAEASFAPASLMMMSWEREEADDDDQDPGKWSGKNGQDNARRQIPGNGIVKGRPTVTVE